MPELSQDAIRELKKRVPVLESLRSLARVRSASQKTFARLQKVYHAVADLTSYDEISTWVGDVSEIEDDPISMSDRLFCYVKGVVESQDIEETLNRLTQENASLKEQLAELRQSESTYLSIIREAQTSLTYSLPAKSGETLLDSLQRRRESLTKTLWRYEEQKAQYGPLDVPPYILNAIDQTQQDLRQIEATIADLEASKTDTNRRP